MDGSGVFYAPAAMVPSCLIVSMELRVDFGASRPQMTALRSSFRSALLEAGAQVGCALKAQKIPKSASAKQKILDIFAPFIGRVPAHRAVWP
jgi:hypothetical protein